MAKLTTSIPMTPAYTSFTNTSYSYGQNNYSMAFLYTAANWDSISNIYLEAIVKVTSGQTVYVALTDTSNTVLASSEITSTSTTFEKIRTAALTLTNATEYRINVKVSGGTGNISFARIIVEQSGTITKTETHILLDGAGSRSIPGDSTWGDRDPMPMWTFNSSEWDGITASYLETIAYNQVLIGLFDNVSGSSIKYSNNGDMTRTRSTSFTHTNSRTYRIGWRNNSGGAVTCYLSYAKVIILQTNFTKCIKPVYLENTILGVTSSSYAETGQYGYYDADEQEVQTISRNFLTTLKEFGTTGYIELYDGTSSIGEVNADTSSFTQLTSTPTFADNKTYRVRAKMSSFTVTVGIALIRNVVSALASTSTTYDKTVTAKTRIKQVVTKTVTAKARIKNFINKTTTAKTRIFSTGILQTITAKVDIKILKIENTISAKANIIKMGPWDETRDYEIITGGVQFTETIQAKVDIIIWEEDSDIWNFVVNTPQTINAKTRVLKITSQTVTAKARIFSTGTTKTVAAKVRIKIPSNTKTCTAKTRILSSGTIKTIQAKTRVKTTQNKTITAKTRIKIVNITKTVAAKIRIKKQLEKTITAKVRIKQFVEKTVTAKTRIKNTGTTKTITAKTCIVNTVSKTVTAKVRIVYDVRTKTVTAKTRIKQQALSETVTAKVNILTINSKTITARVRVKCESISKTVSAKACIVFLRNQTIQAKSRILVLSTKTLTAKIRIKSLGKVKTISAKVRVATSNITKTVLAKTRIKQLCTKTISAKALIWVRTLYTKTISAKVDIFNVVTQTVTAKTRIIYAPPQTVKVAHGVGMFNKIYDLEQGVVGNIVIIKIKSGKVHTVVINSS